MAPLVRSVRKPSREALDSLDSGSEVVSTGEIELRGDDLLGLAVHIAQRVSATAGDGEVVVSRTVVDLVAGSEIEFDDLGEHELKGVGGTTRLFRVRTTPDERP